MGRRPRWRLAIMHVTFPSRTRAVQYLEALDLPGEDCPRRNQPSTSAAYPAARQLGSGDARTVNSSYLTQPRNIDALEFWPPSAVHGLLRPSSKRNRSRTARYRRSYLAAASDLGQLRRDSSLFGVDVTVTWNTGKARPNAFPLCCCPR